MHLWQLFLGPLNREWALQRSFYVQMVITVLLSGDLGLTSQITPNKSFSLVLCRVGVPGANILFNTLPIANVVSLSLCRCRALSGQLDGSDDASERRSRAHTDFLCTRCEMGLLYDNYGIIGDVIVRIQHSFDFKPLWSYRYQPFTNEFPRADIHELIAPDLLHQIIKGTFKDHLVTWVEELLMHIHHHNRRKVNQILDDIDHRWVVCHFEH